MSSGDKHHLLLVGPRGSGKTNLVTLAVHALRANPTLSDSMRVAWLGEDDVFSGLVHLAFAIAKSLADEYPTEFSQDFKTPVRGLPPDDAALAVLHSVLKNLGSRNLLLVTENLDQTFDSLGDLGRKKLRAFLQETRRIAILATSQQLFAGVSSRKEAFFGFFTPHHLQPLSVDDAHKLIRNIAAERENTELLTFLDSMAARYRIRALHHLAGGNYRMYVLLSDFLTSKTLDDLVSAFEILAEEMTPFFQERIRSLPDQQRQLVQCLCDATGALTVKEIAQETFIAENSCSKQLGLLKEKGYVRSEKRGKESFYDMNEPLMRLCLEVKNQRSRPLKLVTRFLKVWFPSHELTATLDEHQLNERTAEYCRAALSIDDSYRASINNDLTRSIQEALAVGQYQTAIDLAAELSESEPFDGRMLQARAHQRQGQNREAIDLLNLALANDANLSPTKVGLAKIHRGKILGQMGDPKAAIRDFDYVINLDELSRELKVHALLNRGVANRELGNHTEALRDWARAIDLSTPGDDTCVNAFRNRIHLNTNLGQYHAAKEDCVHLISTLDRQKIPGRYRLEALRLRGMLYTATGKWEGAIADYQEAIASAPSVENLSNETTALRFELLHPMIASLPANDFLLALQEAFEQGDKASAHYGGEPADLLDAILDRAASRWRVYISAMTPLYVQHGVAAKLGQALTRTIQMLDKRGFSAAQIDQWCHVWHEVGEGVEELEIPLACLDAAVEILRSPVANDLPLFRLPLEIRELIRPLLNKKLAT
ncbi:MAG: tetratricopeptide repeat protein [Planctomycetota bacterium]